MIEWILQFFTSLTRTDNNGALALLGLYGKGPVGGCHFPFSAFHHAELDAILRHAERFTPAAPAQACFLGWSAAASLDGRIALGIPRRAERQGIDNLRLQGSMLGRALRLLTLMRPSEGGRHCFSSAIGRPFRKWGASAFSDALSKGTLKAADLGGNGTQDCCALSLSAFIRVSVSADLCALL